MKSLPAGRIKNDASNRIPLAGNLVGLQASNIGATSEFGEHFRPIPKVPPFAGLDTLRKWKCHRQWNKHVFILPYASFSGQAGTTYSISVDSVSSQSAGVVRLAIWPLPLNDEFADRFQITGTNITLTGTNAEATGEPGEMLLGVGNTLWWSWTAPETGPVHLGFGNDGTVAEVFAGNSLTNLNLVASNPNADDFSFIANAGNTYQISLDTESNSTPGIVTATLTQLSEPPNDDFTNAFILWGSPVQTTGTNLGATLEPGEPNQDGSNAASVWWKWTAPATQQMTISTSGTMTDFLSSPFDTVIGVYTGSILPSLTLIELGTNMGSFAAVSNTTYSIAATGIDGATGYINLSLTPTPLNDDFARRQRLKGIFGLCKR